tara:strand:- start:141343 stop:143025 length:1683 start_codon:yes stop_codon:yes gene_type:complete
MKEFGFELNADVENYIDILDKTVMAIHTDAELEQQLPNIHRNVNMLLGILQAKGSDVVGLGYPVSVMLDQLLNNINSVIDYKDDNQKIKHYGLVLQSYFDLMSAMLKIIPDETFSEYKPEIKTEIYKSKLEYMLKISDILSEKSGIYSLKQLSPSNKIHPPSAVFTSAASFERQFVNKRADCTLGDIYQLMKLNVHAVLFQFDKTNQVTKDKLPEPMLVCYDHITTISPEMRGKVFPARIIYMRHTDDQLTLEYTVPLAFHAISVNLTYKAAGSKVLFDISFWGEPRDRMLLIKNLTKDYLALCSSKVTKTPHFEEEKWAFECAFEIDTSRPEQLLSAINMVKLIGRMSFYDHKILFNEIILAVHNSYKKDEDIIDNFCSLLNTFAFSKSSYVGVEDMLACLALMQARDLPYSKMVPLLKRLFSTEILATSTGLNDFIFMYKRCYGDVHEDALCNAILAKISFVEALILNKHSEYLDIMLSNKNLKPSLHTRALKIAADQKDFELIDKLIDKGFHSVLSAEQETSLLTRDESRYQQYQMMKDNAPKSRGRRGFRAGNTKL